MVYRVHHMGIYMISVLQWCAGASIGVSIYMGYPCGYDMADTI